MPDHKNRCKFHYVLHYPYFLRHMGPLKEFWTMRFEGRHQIFKKFMKTIKQYKNVTLSLAERFQSMDCITNNTTFDEPKMVFKCNSNFLFMHDFDFEIVSHLLSVPETEVVKWGTCVSFTTWSYKIGHFITFQPDGQGNIVCRKICHIFAFHGIFFCLCNHFVCEFVSHFNASVIKSNGVNSCIPLNEKTCGKPLDVSIVNDTPFLVFCNSQQFIE